MFTNFDATNKDHLTKLLELIDSQENRDRKRKSITEHEIFKNKLEKHIYDRLEKYNSTAYAKTVSIVKSIGLCQRVIKNEASIYIEPPVRDFTGTNKKKFKKEISDLYALMRINQINKKQNRYFKLQSQNVSYIVKNADRELEKKVLKMHEFDIIPNVYNPSKPFGYVLSNYNQPAKKSDRRYVLWTKDFNFTFNGNATILEKKQNDMKNPIAPLLPFSDCFHDKDGDFFTDEVETSVEFTLKFNQAFSELYHIMRMQGFGQAVLKGSKGAIPKQEELSIGPNKILAFFLEEGESVDFDFVNASPDLTGAIEVIATLLSAFLTSKGVDPKKISIKGDSAQSFASGFERFLAMIDEFKATLDDIEVMRNAEIKDFEIIKAWLEVYKGSPLLKDEYKIKEDLSQIKLNINFYKPTVIETKESKSLRINSDFTNGQISKLQAIKEHHNFESIEEATEQYILMKDHEKSIMEIDEKYFVPPVVINESEESEPNVDDKDKDKDKDKDVIN